MFSYLPNVYANGSELFDVVLEAAPKEAGAEVCERSRGLTPPCLPASAKLS